MDVDFRLYKINRFYSKITIKRIGGCCVGFFLMGGGVGGGGGEEEGSPVL